MKKGLGFKMLSFLPHVQIVLRTRVALARVGSASQSVTCDDASKMSKNLTFQSFGLFSFGP